MWSQFLDLAGTGAIFIGMQPLSKQAPPVNAAIRIRPGKRNSLRQVLQLQQAAFETILLLKEDVVRSADASLRARIGSSMAQLAKSFDALEDRKRILRGRPLPGSLKPEKQKPRPNRTAPFPEPIEPSEKSISQSQPDEITSAMYPEPLDPSEPTTDECDEPDTASVDPPEGPCATDSSPSVTGTRLPVPVATEPVLLNRTLKMGDYVAYLIPPNGPRIVGTVIRVPSPHGGFAEIRTPEGEIRSFNPDLVPWQHFDRSSAP